MTLLRPQVLVLGIAQDAGVPQAGSPDGPDWREPSRRHHAACLAVTGAGRRCLIDATPGFPDQLHLLDRLAPRGDGERPIDEVFLTHAHIGHYTGLVHLGVEAMNASRVTVHAMARMRAFLESNGPWDSLVRDGNVELRTLSPGEAVSVGEETGIVPIPVPHRGRYSETVGFRIDGPSRRVLYVPDIDGWDDWDAAGTRIEDVVASVDVAYVDGTFFDDDELPSRDRATIAHPTIEHTMERLAHLPASERRKVRFIHLNHSNPVLDPDGEARRRVREAGFEVAEAGTCDEI